MLYYLVYAQKLTIVVFYPRKELTYRPNETNGE
jgi:hypothetical protein